MTLGDLEATLDLDRSTEVVEIYEDDRKIEFETDQGDEIKLSTAGNLAREVVTETRLYYEDGVWTVEIV